MLFKHCLFASKTPGGAGGCQRKRFSNRSLKERLGEWQTPSDMRRIRPAQPLRVREESAGAWCTHVYYIGLEKQIQEAIANRLQFVERGHCDHK